MSLTQWSEKYACGYPGASHLGQFTQTAWEPNAKLGKVLGT